MAQFNQKVKETINNLKQVESLVQDLYLGRMGLITKERICMVSTAVNEAIEALISIEAMAKSRTNLQE
ncbi:MAG: hypothetical protein WC628_08380 [Candidatus Omnitrophota bacterium]